MTTPESIQADYAPRLAEAAARDESRRAERAESRDAALIQVPHTICGLTTRVMTLDDYLTLSVLGNANVTDVPEPEDPSQLRAFWSQHHAQFLWWLSPDYRHADPAARERFIVERLAGLPLADVEVGVTEYLREIFADAPRAAPAAPAATRPPAHAFSVSFAVHWIARIAERFHWSRAEIRALPLPELFQYLNLITAARILENRGKLPPALDGEEDRLWAEMLAKINALNPS